MLIFTNPSELMSVVFASISLLFYCYEQWASESKRPKFKLPVTKSFCCGVLILNFFVFPEYAYSIPDVGILVCMTLLVLLFTAPLALKSQKNGSSILVLSAILIFVGANGFSFQGKEYWTFLVTTLFVAALVFISLRQNKFLIFPLIICALISVTVDKYEKTKWLGIPVCIGSACKHQDLTLSNDQTIYDQNRLLELVEKASTKPDINRDNRSIGSCSSNISARVFAANLISQGSPSEGLKFLGKALDKEKKEQKLRPNCFNGSTLKLRHQIVQAIEKDLFDGQPAMKSFARATQNAQWQHFLNSDHTTVLFENCPVLHWCLPQIDGLLLQLLTGKPEPFYQLAYLLSSNDLLPHRMTQNLLLRAYSDNFYDGVASSLNLIYANGIETPTDFVLLSHGINQWSAVSDLQLVQANGFRYWIISFGFWNLKHACVQAQTHKKKLNSIDQDSLKHVNWKPLIKELGKDFDRFEAFCKKVNLL